MIRLTSIILSIFLSYALFSCEKGCCCHLGIGDKATVKIDVDWKDFTEEKPTGMTVLCYDKITGEYQRRITNDINSIYLSLSEGMYDFMVFNQTESEFGYLSFANLDNLSDAIVKANKANRTAWLYLNGDVIEEPEGLAAGTLADIPVTDEMVVQSSGSHCKCKVCECMPLHSTEIISLGTIYPQSILYTLEVNVRIDGINNLKAVRGAIDGISVGLYLSNGVTLDEHGVIILQTWGISMIDNYTGFAHSSNHCFGLPDKIAENTLELHLLLKDNTVINKLFDVGNMLDIDHDKRVIRLNLDFGERLPDIKQPDNSGGFDASVLDWDDEAELDVNL